MLFIVAGSVSCDKQLSVSPPEELPPNGKIIVSSMPAGYQIYINDKISGKVTPDSFVYLQEGDFNISLQSPIFLDTLVNVELLKNETTNLVIDVENNSDFMGQIECLSTPDNCLILLNDSSTGLYTPNILYKIYPGLHKVALRKKGFRDGVKNVIVKSNETTKVEKALVDTTIWLVLNSEYTNIPTGVFNKLIISPLYLTEIWGGTTNYGLIKLNDPIYDTYNIHNSPLTVNMINDLDITNEGLILLGTNDGLFTMQNNNWHHFKSGSKLVPGDSITTVAFSKKSYSTNGDNYFIGSRTRGLVYFNDIDTVSFNTSNSNIPSNYITSIDARGSRVYIGTADAGIYYSTSASSMEYNVLNSSNSNIPGDEVYVVAYQPANGNLWAGIDKSTIFEVAGALAYYSRSTWTELDINHYQVYCILPDFSTTWIGTSGGLFKIYNNKIVGWFNKNNSPMESNSVYDLVVDSYGKLWMATSSCVIGVKKEYLYDNYEAN